MTPERLNSVCLLSDSRSFSPEIESKVNKNNGIPPTPKFNKGDGIPPLKSVSTAPAELHRDRAPLDVDLLQEIEHPRASSLVSLFCVV